MLNKIKNIFMFAVVGAVFAAPVMADEIWVEEEEWAEEVSAEAVAVYEMQGSLFQQITDLEQEKVLLQLEKERAQLDLELDRLAAEKIKLHMEIDTLAGRAEEQQQAIEAEKAKLEAEMAKLEREKKQASSAADDEVAPKRATAKAPKKEEVEEGYIADRYRLVDIIGAGNQLQATVEDNVNGQRKKISVGKTLDGYSIKSISLDDGVMFVKDDVVETLNIGSGK